MSNLFSAYGAHCTTCGKAGEKTGQVRRGEKIDGLGDGAAEWILLSQFVCRDCGTSDWLVDGTTTDASIVR